jgi:hypothetical protein
METSSKTVHVGINLDFQEAIDDSPHFRASLQSNEDELDELAALLETLVRSSRNSLEYAASTNAFRMHDIKFSVINHGAPLA